MNKSPQKRRSLRPLSSELIYTIPFSLITAHLFVGFRRKENYLELFLKPGYWPGFLVSAGIAFLLILYVKYISRYIYLKPDVSKRGKLFLQVVFGFLGAIVLEFGCSTAYFGYAGYDISDTVYFNSYLLPIVMYIVLINLWYAEGIQHLESRVVEELSQVIEIIPEPIIIGDGNLVGDIEPSVSSAKVVYIGIFNSKHYCRYGDGNSWYWDMNFIESMLFLSSHDYFRVHRNLIIHRDIICIIDPQPKDKKLTIYLKTPFNEKVEVVPSSIAKFNIWLEAGKNNFF